MGVGHYVSRALDLAARLKLADQLRDGPRVAEAVADATGTHAPSLRRVMRLLASVGVFEERDDGSFALTPVGELLRTDHPESMCSAVRLFAGVGIQDGWRELEFCVRTGEPAFRKEDPSADAFSFMESDPEQSAVFDEAMATFTRQTSAVVAAMFDFSPFGSLVDVGGGNGALLCGILKAFPDLRGTVFDRPSAASGAAAEIERQELGGRCEFVAGDFFESVPPGADAYLLKHVIHDWDDERARSILETCREAMPGHGKLLLVEGMYPPRIDRSLASRGAAANDVNMLVCTGGRQRSEAEFRALYAAAGFQLTHILPTPARVCVIQGEID
jgi:hypothetical protein